MSSIIYLAARYGRLEEILGYAEELRAVGYEVSSRWLDGPGQGIFINSLAKEVEAAPFSVPRSGRLFAQIDYKDVEVADTLIAFTESSVSVHNRGGRHVEFGLALAWDLRLIMVGPRENIFYTLPQVEHFRVWGPKVIKALGED